MFKKSNNIKLSDIDYNQTSTLNKSILYISEDIILSSFFKAERLMKQFLSYHVFQKIKLIIMRTDLK
jgi:hypothetical protein